jgi:hypothetical protein
LVLYGEELSADRRDIALDVAEPTAILRYACEENHILAMLSVQALPNSHGRCVVFASEMEAFALGFSPAFCIFTTHSIWA